MFDHETPRIVAEIIAIKKRESNYRAKIELMQNWLDDLSPQHTDYCD